MVMTLVTMSDGDASFSSHFDHHERNILILYATETGNALDIAEQLTREARRRQFSVRLLSVDAYPLVCLRVYSCFSPLNDND